MINRMLQPIFVIAFPLLLTGSILAQTTIMEGTVSRRNPDGTLTPVAGATIDIYRTDHVNQHWETKTDKNGRFTYQGMLIRADYVIVASAPGIRFGLIRLPIRTGRLSKSLPTTFPPLDIVARSGDGRRPIFEEVKAIIAPEQLTADDEAAIEAARKEAKAKLAEEARLKDKEALQAIFDQARARFNKGIEFTRANPPDHKAAIREFEVAAYIAPSKNADFAELFHSANANLAESNYQVGVDLFNEKKRDEARPHFEEAIKAIYLALTVASSSTNPAVNKDLLIYYGIMVKNVQILVRHYGRTDLIDSTVTSLDKAASLDTDKEKWKRIQDELRNASQRKNP